MSCARLLLLAALPALAGVCGEVVSVTESYRSSRGPSFAPRQRTTLIAAVGQPATLECRVKHLADKAVSWVRSRDLQILTHAGAVFTADARVSAAEGTEGVTGGVTRHALHIERLRVSDSGRYECQVNTEPKMSLFFNLTVLDEPVPHVVVSVADEGGEVVTGTAGGTATLACSARYEPEPRALPLPGLEVRWRRLDDSEPMLLQGARGGVSLDTERWAARVVSRLTLAGLSPEDEGDYECTSSGVSTTVHLVFANQEERMEMQRDEAGNGAGHGNYIDLLRATLWGLLTILLFL